MKALRFATVLPLLLGIAACAGESAEAKVMPAVEGQQLDVALSDLKRTGIDEDDVEVLGGGAFGIRNESNWKVCEQLPAAGDAVDGKPRLTVARSCDDEDNSEEAKSDRASETTTTEEATTTTSTEAPKPVEEVLTAANNADLAALLDLRDECSDTIGQFAATYRNRIIEFDGNIGAMDKHGSSSTRYDILIGAGDFSETTSSGPNFQFRDVAMHDLNLPPASPSSVGVRDNLHVVARVREYESRSCLFLLNPVATRVR